MIRIPYGDFVPFLNVEDDEKIAHGAIFRIRGSIPHESILDLMLVETYDAQKGMGLMVSTGCKAGLMLQILPVESGSGSTDAGWLKENWDHWVYPGCSLADVYFSTSYPVPALSGQSS